MLRLGLTIALVVAAASPGAADYSGYWRQSTPKGQSRECRLVESQAQLVSELQAVGWNMDRTPIVDWNQDCAIIIAPEHFYEGQQLAFFGLDWNGNAPQFELVWGYEPLPPAGGPTQGSDGGWSYSQGSNAAGPETMVVSFQHFKHAQNKLVCLKRD